MTEAQREIRLYINEENPKYKNRQNPNKEIKKGKFVELIPLQMGLNQ